MDANAQAPVANFSASTVSGCGPLAVTFSDLSSGSPVFWNWDFGNGQISSLPSPSISYTTPGLYTVKLTVVNKNGQDSITKVNYISVSPYPSINFTSNLRLACSPTNIQFTDLSTPGQGSITQWLWDFGDGASSTTPNPGHLYTQTGYFTVNLMVTNSQGCSHTSGAARYIRVVPGIQSDFAFMQTSNSCSAPFLLNFNNQTAGPGTLSYAWDLGNGSTPTQTNPSTSYPANTSYTVTLTTQSSLGCSNSIQETITFPAANALITAPDSVCISNPVSFKNASSPAPVSSAWSFGDGHTSILLNPSNTYAAIGSYSVKLVNTYSTCTDSATKTIAVVTSPTADFTSTTTAGCKTPYVASFTPTPAPGAVKWVWNFGDGSPPVTVTTPPGSPPQHTYSTTGAFDVTLVVTNSAGCSDSIRKPKFVQVITPSVILNNPDEEGCYQNATVFHPIAVVNSADGVATYSWNAVGATPSTSTSPAPAFTYPAAGVYNISLTITTVGGCSATTVFNNAITVGIPTPAAFTIIPSPAIICRQTPINLSSSSTPAEKWEWNFGDGVFAEADSNTIHHTYKNEGIYDISLTVIHDGCPSSIFFGANVQVNPPIAGFSFTTDCSDNSVTFTDTSEIDAAQATTYIWDFGDTTPTVTILMPVGAPVGSGTPLPHTYAFLGQHTVTLTVSNDTCTDQKAQIITLDAPTASLIAPDSVCRAAAFTMTSTSTDTALIADYTWIVSGNIGQSTGRTPSFPTTPTVNGPLSLKLIITDINGCFFPSSSISTEVIGPTAKFDTTGPGGCLNSPILFKDQSTIDVHPILNWAFIFGDGVDTDFLAPPFVHRYADTGYFQVRLTIQDTHSCLANFTLDSAVHITSLHAGFFAADTLYCPNVPLPFTDSSQGHITSWSWDLGGGMTSVFENPAPPYPTNGQHYTIKLKISDQAGCSDSLTRTNYIHIQSPIAAFSVKDTTSICFPLQTTFTPNPQFYDSLYWDFGDGSTSTLPNTTHFYNTYDTFTAKLFLQGAGGCLDSASRRIFVLNPTTTTSITYLDPLIKCDSVPMDFIIVPPGYTKYELFFGDLTADSSGNLTPFHMFRSPNTYGQELQLQDSTGCIVVIGGAKLITVRGATPFFSIDKHDFCDSSTVNFTDFTRGNDPITSETLLFGDGSSVTLPPNPSYDYLAPDTYLPTLKVTTMSGCAESYTDTVRVYQTPHPTFTISNQPCGNVPVQFMGSTTQPETDPITWAWDFGDGQTSAQQDPAVTYKQPNTYRVTLKTSLPFGCGDTTSQLLDLHPLPTIKGPAEITIPVGFPSVLPFTYSAGVVGYSWTPATDLSCIDCPNPLAGPIFATEYSIQVTDTNNCSMTDSILVKTVCNGKNYFIPNTFSPNGDGVNDVFYPRGKSLYNIQSMRVFNRWGQLVFEKRDFPANSAASGWDGTFNGRAAPMDVYAYTVEVICDNAQLIALNGNVTLVR
jgi:gliding motility-associated-like protein